MNNWLDKYEQGGMVLKQKTKDNYGKKANPNNPDVSLPPGFKGLAYNTKGRNYSPAWGGQFQMGGSLPGAVGFTYARTAGAAPSNGPYAKKTKASAQNGKEMKFYQAGLDFKPKNISQDGSEIPNAQLGTHMLPIDASKAAENFFELLSVPQKAITALFSGKYQTPSEAMGIKNTAGALAVDAVLDPVNLIGAGAVGKVGKAAKAAVKASKESGVLSKAHKLNPKAYHYNLPKDAMWRGLGKEGMEDAVESGLFRAKQNVIPEYYPGSKLQINKSFGENPYFTPKFNTAATYGDNFIAEVPRDVANWRNRYGRGKTWSQVADRPIPIDQGRILQKDWLKGYKEVPKPKKKEDGGDIKKDDNGYWNPENWGEPVEIGSNNITMQGVYEPLLGISDTGDVQYMMPGEDYEFDGEYVTEYPVAKKGISVNNADAQPIKKLDQSLNFTNYNKPTKGGWLDKYN